MLVIDPSKCSGCRRCETHCSFYHSGRTGYSGARIKVEKIELIGLDFPIVCHQCKEHYCTRCPQKAVRVTPGGSIEVSPTLCNVCGACEQLCPIGAIEIYNDIPQVCDLCGGSPRCVIACDMGAIEYVADESQTISLAPYKERSKNKNPAQKRYEYAVEGGERLRAQWFKDRR